LAAGNISLEALKDHQESLIQGARMNETIVVGFCLVILKLLF
jgi:hypothetical protein